MSGLELAGKEAEHQEMVLASKLLADWLTGSSGTNEEELVSKICRIVIAGNSIDWPSDVRKVTV